MVRWLPCALALLAVSCVEVDPLLPCRDKRDCPAGEHCRQEVCTAPPADAAPVEADAAVVEPDMAVLETACDRACARIADCAVSDDHCPDLGPEARSFIIDGCVPGCDVNPQFALLVQSKRDCTDLIAAVSPLNPPFAAACGEE